MTSRTLNRAPAVLLLLARHLAPAQVPLAREPLSASIHVEVVDLLGRPLSGAEVTLAAQSGAAPKTYAAKEGDFGGIPFGKYVLNVAVRGFRTYSESVSVDREEVWRTVALEISTPHTTTPEPVLAGRLSPPPGTGGRTWARLLGIYNGVRLEAPISERGFFHLEPGVDGIYVLVILNQDRVLDMRRVDVFGYTSVTIERVAAP